jgi:16S rRNA (cytosine967-C5)-methyltransferase
LNTRSLAADVLVQVIHEGKSLTAALEPALFGIAESSDRAFVQALCYGVMRWYWRLDRLLGQLTRKPIKDERVRALALLGLYQLQFMRVKPHAAVAETVSAAGARAWAKPLLNGILRTYQRERESLDARANEHEASACAHPSWLFKKLQKDWSTDAIALFQNNNEPPPLTLRVNRLKQTREAYLARLAEQNISATASPACDSAITLDHPIAVEAIPGFASGDVSVQDAAAQLAAGLLNLEKGHRVLDLCAAPGGKTAHILECCPEISELVAVDVSGDRLVRVQENLDRIGLQATLVRADALTPADWWDQRPFDRILVDAPCSATGVIRRHPDIKVLRQPYDIDELCRTQLQILESAWSMLAKDGQLLYATCSVLRAENEETIARFLREHAEAAEVSINADWGVAASHGRQILTGMTNMDGFYYARLAKTEA